MNIYSSDNKIRTTIGLNVGAKGVFNLGVEEYVTLPFNVENPIPFVVGDWCDLGELEDGLATKFRKRFVLLETPFPSYDKTTGAYHYDLQMHAYYWAWQNKIFKYFNVKNGLALGAKETSWALTDTLDTHMDVFMRNLNDLGITYNSSTPFKVDIASNVTTEKRLVSYENTNLIDALTSLAETFECEWWVDGYFIRFGQAEDEGEPSVTFTLGDNASTMERSDSEGTYATRLYVFGSEKNIPTNYRQTDAEDVTVGIATRKLMLPKGTPYIDAYRYDDSGNRVYIGEDGYETASEMSKAEAVESSLVIDDVYPRFVTTMSDVDYWVEDVLEEDTNEDTGKDERFYVFKAGFDFSEQYIVSNDSDGLQIRFTGGSLNGMTFGVHFHEKGLTLAKHGKEGDADYKEGKTIDGQLFEIVPEENNGVKIPNETLYPKDGDEFVLIGWDASKFQDSATDTAVGKIKSIDYRNRVGDDVFYSAPQADVLYQEKMKEEGKEYKPMFLLRFTTDSFYAGELKHVMQYKGETPYLAVRFLDGVLEGWIVEIPVKLKDEWMFGETVKVEDNTLYMWVTKNTWDGHLENLTDDAIKNTVGCSFEIGKMDGGKFVAFKPEDLSPFRNLLYKAENELLDKGTEFVKKSMVDDGVYKVTLASDWVAQTKEKVYKLVSIGGNLVRVTTDEGKKFLRALVKNRSVHRYYDLGQRVRLVHPAFFDDKRVSRIIGYELCLDIPYDSPVYSVGESVQYSRIGELEAKIDAIQFTGTNSSSSSSSRSTGSNLYLIKSGDDNTEPSNRNVYSAARTKEQFLEREDVVNYDSENVDTDHVYSTFASEYKFLQKDKANQTVAQMLKFARGLSVGDFNSGVLGAGAVFRMLDGKSEIEVDNLRVRQLAKFVELAIQRVEHAGGQIILSPASMTVKSVVKMNGSKELADDDTTTPTGYKLYYDNTDGSTTAKPQFKTNDLVLSQTFNGKGTQRWWRKITTIPTNGNYIIVSNKSGGYESGSTEPQAGDVVVQLGNIDNTSRQSAIILSTVDDDSPSIKFYSGIKTFSLEGKAHSYFTRNGNRIVGDFFATADGTDSIHDMVQTLSTSVTGTQEELEQFKQSLDNINGELSNVNTTIENTKQEFKAETAKIQYVEVKNAEGKVTGYKVANISTNGLVTTENAASLLSNYLDSNGYQKAAEISTSIDTAVKNGVEEKFSQAKISADQVVLSGNITMNDRVSIDTNGTVRMKNAIVEGSLNTQFSNVTSEDFEHRTISYKSINGSFDELPAHNVTTSSGGVAIPDGKILVTNHAWMIKNKVNVDADNILVDDSYQNKKNSGDFIILPQDAKWIGTRVIIKNSISSSSPVWTWVAQEYGGEIFGAIPDNCLWHESGATHSMNISQLIGLNMGIIELLCVPRSNSDSGTQWVIINFIANNKRIDYYGYVKVE